MSRHRLLDLSKFPDCSGLSENGKCTRIMVSNCQGEKCSFKRTLKEDLDSIQWVNQRLSNLDSSTQKHIAEKYYGGSMPWNGEMSLRSYSWYKRLKSSKYKIKINI